jgi:hypothetical protein
VLVSRSVGRSARSVMRVMTSSPLLSSPLLGPRKSLRAPINYCGRLSPLTIPTCQPARSARLISTYYVWERKILLPNKLRLNQSNEIFFKGDIFVCSLFLSIFPFHVKRYFDRPITTIFRKFCYPMNCQNKKTKAKKKTAPQYDILPRYWY